MIIAIADVWTQVPQRDAARAVMERARREALAEPGCVRFEFAELIGDPGHFLNLQQWNGRPALDAHYGTPSFAVYQTDITPLLVRDSELTVYEVGESFRPNAGDELDLHQDD